MNGWWLFYALIRFFFQYWCVVYHRFGPYFCEPIIAGLNEEGTPFICTTDLIGAKYENSCYFIIPVWFDSSLDSVLCSPSCPCTVRWFLHDVAPWTQIDKVRISNHELRYCCGGQVRGDARPLRGSEVNFKWKKWFATCFFCSIPNLTHLVLMVKKVCLCHIQGLTDLYLLQTIHSFAYIRASVLLNFFTYTPWAAVLWFWLVLHILSGMVSYYKQWQLVQLTLV